MLQDCCHPLTLSMLINDLDEIYCLSDWIVQKASEEGSVWAQFLELFTVEFVLDNLDSKSQKQFLQMITEGDGKALDFACSKIKNFNNKYSQALTEKFLSLLERKELDGQN